MTPYLLIALAASLLAVYLLTRTLLATQRRLRIAEGKAQAAEAARLAISAEFVARERDRRALEEDLARLRAGSPSARLDASLGILRDASVARGTGALAHGLADLGAAARRDQPRRD